MKKRTVILGALIIQIAMVTSLSCSAGVIKDPPEDLLPAAEKILSEDFDKNSHDYIEKLPYFHPEDNLMDFRLGEPFPQYKLHAGLIYKLKDNNDFKDALEFLIWMIPIYIGDEKEPRTMFTIRKKSDGKWSFAGMGGYPQPILEARERWPSEDGYKHANLIRSKSIVIMFEKDSQLQFYYYNDEGGERLFGISKNKDGSYPVFSKDYLIKVLKDKKKFSREETGVN